MSKSSSSKAPTTPTASRVPTSNTTTTTPRLSTATPRRSVVRSPVVVEVPPSTPRQALPISTRNLLLVKTGKLHELKLQTLVIPPNDTITIARVKCPVPKGTPAHLIKRLDTNAVSASSMFRVAFPEATQAEEESEMRYISHGSRQRYGDTRKAGAEHEEKRILNGTWIPASKALLLADEYKIKRYAEGLILHKADEQSSAKAETNPPSTPPTPKAPAKPSVTASASKLKPESVTAPSPRSSRVVKRPRHSTGMTSLSSTDVSTSTHSKRTQTLEVVEISLPSTSLDSIATDQIKQSQQLVESLKKKASTSSKPVAKGPTKKRVLEEEEPTERDSRGFLKKLLFKRGPTGTRRGGKERALVEVPQVVVEDEGEGKTSWTSSVGLVLAVGATAAIPYFFG